MKEGEEEREGGKGREGERSSREGEKVRARKW